MAMPNSISFPTAHSLTSSQESIDNASALSLTHHRAAADVCELFYGASPPAWQAVERLYDAHATYENPFLTATSKDTISDVHALAHALSQLDVPKPGAVLCALFRLSADSRWGGSWFRGVSMWNEVNNISECEAFDGHKRAMAEHTLHILILPGLHSIAQTPVGSPTDHTTPLLLTNHANPQPLPSHHPNLSFWPPSPFHLKLPIITRLSFNEAGKITHHRDFWDVKDLLGLVPGMTLVQWVSGRLAAQSIRGIVRVGRALFRAPQPDEERATSHGSSSTGHAKQQATHLR